MALGTPTFPTTLDTNATLGPTSGIVAGTTPLNAVGTNQGDQLGITNNLINNDIAMEGVIGVTGSTVTTSHEYRIRRVPYKTWVAGLDFNPAATNYGTFGTVNSIPYVSFPAQTVTTTVTFIGMIPWGAITSGGAVVRLMWDSPTATTGNVTWTAACEDIGAATVASDHFASVTTITTTVNGTVATWNESDIDISSANFATFGGTAGNWVRLQIQRLSTDSMASIARLYTVSIESLT
jgi:hypothetical protein